MKTMNEVVRKDMMDYGIAENMNRTLFFKKSTSNKAGPR